MSLRILNKYKYFSLYLNQVLNSTILLWPYISEQTINSALSCLCTAAEKTWPGAQGVGVASVRVGGEEEGAGGGDSVLGVEQRSQSGGVAQAQSGERVSVTGCVALCRVEGFRSWRSRSVREYWSRDGVLNVRFLDRYCESCALQKFVSTKVVFY